MFAKIHKKKQADLAAAVSSILGLPEEKYLSRATIGHWFTGRNAPGLPEFLALCEAMGADPGHILFDVPVLPSMVKMPALKDALHAKPGDSPSHRALVEGIESKARQFKKHKNRLRRVVRVTS